jgi:1,2-diacylglycerol 3-beta-glucosyltransferase
MMLAATFLLTFLVVLFWLCAASSIGYLLILLMSAALPRPQGRVHGPEERVKTLAVLIPAHDEEVVLGETLRSLRCQTYPSADYEIVVIADNCADTTAAIAHAHSATVLERWNTVERGKGYALDWAITQLLRRPLPPDAFVIVDADTWVAPDFLETMARHLPVDGFAALQGRYGVLNSEDGWRASLMSAAFELVNHIKPLGRSRLGLAVGLKGNGMAFTQSLLRAVPWRGDSVTEDLDYALELARQHGVRVEYVPEAVVRAQMPTTGSQAASQRSRWEGGRYRLLRECCRPLFVDGVRRRNLLLCDAAVDLALPPLAELAALLAACTALVALGSSTHCLAYASAWQCATGLTWLGLLGYVLGGLRLAGASRSVYLSLLRAPFYALWKFGLYGMNLLHRRPTPTEWVRTARVPVTPTAPESESP